ncbi:MAG: hypothetical protein JSV12_04225 [Candidatus Bathyarchaeota archaeon]|nr:MAG: hypothetical protein JSV12_04225 [Candidatus Bathyarchaeota archaeon]
MFKTRLNSYQLKKYLNRLSMAGFITEKTGIWKTTEKGLHVIEACEICSHLLEEGH